MKKLLAMLLIAIMALTSAAALAEAIAPRFTEINTTDAEYHAAFKKEDLKDGVLNNVTISTLDVYDDAAVSKMAVGDTFEAEGRSVTIESMETDEDGDININGGYRAENGFTLTSDRDVDGWTTLMDNDYCTYTKRGVFNLALSENVTFIDYATMDTEAMLNGVEPPTFKGIEAVAKAIAEDAQYFSPNNTELRIEGGKVVEITRRYVP